MDPTPCDAESDRFRRSGWTVLLTMVSLGCLVAAPGAARAGFQGDLDGDAVIGPADEALMSGVYDSVASDARYDLAGDLDRNGVIDVGDLAIQGAKFGTTQGIGDIDVPFAIPSLNDVPDNMNDLLVAPPDGFLLTVEFANFGASLMDLSSLEVTSAHDLGPYPAGTDLAPLFDVTPTRASWQVPAGFELPRTTHTVSVRVRDLAGNEAQQDYSFAVRDFPFGQPLGNTQVFFLDFDQDRGFGTFTDDLRDFGLSSAAAPEYEADIRAQVIDEILKQVRGLYGLEPDGSPGEDPVNIVFMETDPGGVRNRICIGGVSSHATAILGLATTDVNNLDESTDECAVGEQFGVFPQAIEALWGGDPDYVAAFEGIDPDLGGVPLGEHQLDPYLLSEQFDPNTLTLFELNRLQAVLRGTRAFARIVAVATAHEIGHMLGLTAAGPAPAGLFGGTTGGREDHNVTVSGATPNEPYVMNVGGSFSFAAITANGSGPGPSFRAMSDAYLRDRLALSEQVTGLYPPPSLTGVSPNPAGFPQGQTTVLTFAGDGFVAPALVDLVPTGGGLAVSVFNVDVVDPQTLTGTINKFLTGPGLYDVMVINGDGQEVTLPSGLLIQ